MTSSFGSQDFRRVEGVALKGDDKEIFSAIGEHLAAAQDRKAFLFENSLPAHEKRHFFDTLSTPFGILGFARSFLLTVEFHNLLNSFGEGRLLRIPLKKWVRQRNCPPIVRQFVRRYDVYSRLTRSFSAGEKWTRPGISSPLIGENQALILEQQDRKIPCSAYRVGDKLRIFELTALPILEGLAFAVQSHSIELLDPEVAKSWRKEVELHPVYWYYTSAQKLAMAVCLNSVDEALKMLEFALMVPVLGEETEVSAEERDPGWRFIAVFNYLVSHPFQRKEMNEVTEIVCDEKGWRRTGENLESAQTLIEQVNMMDESEGRWNYFQCVIDDFRKLSFKLLDERKQEPLMGINYTAYLKKEVMPPIHRKIRPDGTCQVFCDTETAEAWFHFLVMRSMMDDAVEGRRLVCPTSPSRTRGYPGIRECDCESRREPTACFLVEAIESMGLKVVPI